MRDWKPRISTLLFLLVVFAFTTAMARSHKLDGVRGELAGLQEQTGLGLGYFGFVFGKVDFAHRPPFSVTAGAWPSISCSRRWRLTPRHHDRIRLALQH